MYVVIIYDVGVSRIGRVRKFLKRYLDWVQNSALEGEVTKAELIKIKSNLRKMIKTDEDSIMIYAVRSKKFMDKEIIGIEKGETDVII